MEGHGESRRLTVETQAKPPDFEPIDRASSGTINNPLHQLERLIAVHERQEEARKAREKGGNG
jgi:hypothetical protein